MKRFFRIFAVAALACATFVACENKFDDYDPAQQVEGAQAYFSNQNATSYTISKIDVAPITVTLMRGQSEAAISVPITLTQGEEGAFTAPAKVDFKAGSNKATLDITYDPEKLADGSSYKVTLTIGDQSVTTPYGNNEITLTVKVPEPYVLLGKALYRDDIVASAYDLGGFPEYEVEVYKNLNNPDCIYLKNLYTHKFPVSGVDIAPGFEGDTYFAVNIKDPNEVFLPVQYLGIDAGYGNMKVGTNKPGILKDNIITFPVEAFVFAEDDYKDGAWYMYANANGMFRLSLPGAVLADYSLELAYGGFRVDGDDETTYPIARVAFGVDVAQIQYAFVEGDITLDDAAIEATLAGMADGTIATTIVDAVDDTGEEVPAEDSEEEEVEQVYAMDLVSPDALGSGIYTVIALPINAEGEVITDNGDLLSFYNPGVGESEVPDVDMAVYAMSLEELEKYDESLDGLAAAFNSAYGLDATNSIAILAEGSEIAEWKALLVETASIGKIIASGYTLDEYVLAMDAYYEANGSDLDMSTEYINADGWDYGVFGADPGTSYTFLVYAKNAYGKEAMFYASAETEKAEATAKRKLVLHKLDGVELNRNFNNVEIR